VAGVVGRHVPPRPVDERGGFLDRTLDQSPRVSWVVESNEDRVLRLVSEMDGALAVGTLLRGF
jgi:hypothetical protein